MSTIVQEQGALLAQLLGEKKKDEKSKGRAARKRGMLTSGAVIMEDQARMVKEDEAKARRGA
eukprot:10469938-Heterocapsa_arctica.AAC.1